MTESNPTYAARLWWESRKLDVTEWLYQHSSLYRAYAKWQGNRD